MEAEQFRSLASYKIIDHLYDDRKDFIILGMCGKVGSGVSTAARILGMTYEEMDLASPQYKESKKDLTADDFHSSTSKASLESAASSPTSTTSLCSCRIEAGHWGVMGPQKAL